MGVSFVSKEPSRDFMLFDPEAEDYSKAVINISNEATGVKSIHYSTVIHHAVVSEFYKSLNSVTSNGELVSPCLSKIVEEDYIKLLRNVKQYFDADISVQKISLKNEVSSLVFVTKYVRYFKYKQIHSFFDLYRDSELELFSPAEICWGDHKSTIGMIVLEWKDGKYYVIEGNTRLLYCYENKINDFYVAIIKGVQEELPTDGSYTIDQVEIDSEGKEGDTRFNNFQYPKFRKIEESIRPPKESLLDVEVNIEESHEN